MMYAELIGNYEKQRIKSLCDNKLLMWNTVTGRLLVGMCQYSESGLSRGGRKEHICWSIPSRSLRRLLLTY